MEDLLFNPGSEKNPGFIDGLLAAATSMTDALETAMGDKGRYVDTYA